GNAVLPTPTIGVVGLIEHADRVVSRVFKQAGDVIVLLGVSRDELGGSEYLKVMHGLVRGVPPVLDLGAERRLQQVLVEGAASGVIASAHDCAEGGLAITVAESSFDTGLGAEVNAPGVAGAAPGMSDVTTLFGESASRVIVSTAPARAQELLALASRGGVPATVIGRVGGNHVRISIGGRVVIDESLESAERIWSNAIERYFEPRKAIA
ncbi:MAG: AIR synthase-related protein, partial [Steroidobacteraceae bacterium]